MFSDILLVKASAIRKAWGYSDIKVPTLQNFMISLGEGIVGDLMGRRVCMDALE